MRKTVFSVQSSRLLTSDVFELRLSGDASDFTKPGQFVEISVPGLFLRRPISVCDWSDNSLLLLIKTVGAGTTALRDLQAGMTLDVITGLGNGFDAAAAATASCLVGGGIGIAPLYALAKQLLAAGKKVVAVLGFRSSGDLFYADEFKALGCDVRIATEDGSLGTKGFVTDVLKSLPECGYVYACGPLPMLKAIAALPQVKDGQFSLEARMGCGFGACVGCTVKTAGGPKRVCKEGPVFVKEELVW